MRMALRHLVSQIADSSRPRLDGSAYSRNPAGLPCSFDFFFTEEGQRHCTSLSSLNERNDGYSQSFSLVRSFLTRIQTQLIVRWKAIP